MKHEDWPQRLHALVTESGARPFAWGAHDCCLFAARAVEVQTGIDPAADLRGTYSTALEAARILADRGGVQGIASASLGVEIPPTMAQRGDVVMVQTSEHGDTLAVCMGAYCVAPGGTRLERRPMEAATTAWRVL